MAVDSIPLRDETDEQVYQCNKPERRSNTMKTGHALLLSSPMHSLELSHGRYEEDKYKLRQLIQANMHPDHIKARLKENTICSSSTVPRRPYLRAKLEIFGTIDEEKPC